MRSRTGDRRLHTMLGAALLGALLAAGGCGTEPDAPRGFHKVILLSVDTLRADYLDVYTPGLGTSPAVDAFARGAVVFDDAITQATSTLPSHMSLLYSVHTFVHHAYVSSQPHVGVQPPVEALRQAGLRTAAFVGGGQLRPRFGTNAGFDTYEVINTRDIDAENRDQDRLEDLLVAASRFLRRHGDQPFFLFLHTYETHFPYAPPERFVDDLRDGLDEAPGTDLEAPLVGYEADRGVTRDAWLASNRRLQYAAEVRYVDDFFGRLLHRLQNLGLDDEVVIVFMADHGESLGERGILGHNLFYTEQLEVPLLIRVPGIAGRRVDAPAELIDVMPTLFELLGIEQPYTFMGESLVPVLTGADAPAFEDRVRFSENKGRAAVLRGPWKAVFKLDDPDDVALYDLSEDPGELHDLVAERPDLARELVGEYADLVRSHQAVQALFPHGDAPPELDEETLRELRALGYVQ